MPSGWTILFNQQNARLGAIKAASKSVPSGQAYQYPGSGGQPIGAGAGAFDVPPSQFGALVSHQQAIDALREAQYRWPRMSFKVTQNSDLSFAVVVNVDSGQDNKSFAGAAATSLPANQTNDNASQSSSGISRPQALSLGDFFDSEGAQSVDVGVGNPVVGGPASSIGKSYVSVFADYTSFVG
jgi:hypothetical protein